MFDRYLSADVEDLEYSRFDDATLQKILLLPNGRKVSIADESMLTGSLDFAKLRGLARLSLDKNAYKLKLPAYGLHSPQPSTVSL